MKEVLVVFQSIASVFVVFVFEVCFDLFCPVLSDRVLSLLETIDNNE
jgi:hypothetical protein